MTTSKKPEACGTTKQNNMAYSLDFETYSEANIKKVGAYRYAADPSTEILIFAISEDGAPPVTWDATNGGDEAIEMFRKAVDTGSIIYAHNSQFEAAICKYVLTRQLGIDCPDLSVWRCSAAMARRAAIPSSLAQCGEFLGIEKAKDKEGGRLIQKFSVPRKPTKSDQRVRIYPHDEPEEFQRFVDYCVRDVEAEQEITATLHKFELTGAVLASFQLDARINDRGVPVDVETLKHCDRLVNEYSAKKVQEFRELVGLNPTQGAKIIAWAKPLGYPYDNLQAATVEKFLERDADNADQIVVEALKIRSLVAFAAVKKIPTLISAACPDGRVRGSLLWSGAERTHRWSGRIIQPQNFAKPRIKFTEEAYSAIQMGLGVDEIEAMFGDFLSVIVSVIRHFIKFPESTMLQADYSAIEARVNPWLCGGERTLDLFRRGECPYPDMGAKIFGSTPEQVLAEHRAGNSEKRQLGKAAILGAGFGMGRPKFRATIEGWGTKLSSDIIETFKAGYPARLADKREAAKLREPWNVGYQKSHLFEHVDTKDASGAPERMVFVRYADEDGNLHRVADMDNPTASEWYAMAYDDLADRAITAWRDANPEIVNAWRSFDTAAKDAIRNPGKVFYATKLVKFQFTKSYGFPALICKLPSDHILVYPRASITYTGDDEKPNFNDNFNTSVKFWGKGTARWEWRHTYGGSLLENVTQAVAGDIMAHGAINAERAGYEAFMLVHDEMLCEKTSDDMNVTELENLISDTPDWSAGLPIKAEGALMPFYKK